MPRKGSPLRRWYCLEVGYGARNGQYIGKVFATAQEISTLSQSIVIGNLVRVGARDMSALRAN